ncbi:S-layer homology domain-containing protein [Sporanaerobacter acetigenes]|uniref:S-layer homology domain-containing protein n=1 Tax=Sporanaerobacter acetigenes TaxID=165813 RepID=UPI00332B0FD9
MKNRTKKILSILFMSLMIFSNGTTSFAGASDIVNHWAKADILYLSQKDIMKGYPDGTFKPNNYIKKAEFYKIINGIMGYSETAEINFLDVNKGNWFYDEVAKGVKAGYILEKEGQNILPNTYITREEVARIVGITCGLEEDIFSASYFLDHSEIDNLSLGYVGAIKNVGYMTGYPDGTFGPKKQITRAESAKILANISKNMIQTPEIKPEDNTNIEWYYVEPVKQISKDEEFIKLIKELPNLSEINEITVETKTKTENARKLFDGLSDVEKVNVPQGDIDKLLKVEGKIQSLKIPIKSRTKATVEQGQAWAIKKGAHKRFVDAAPIYWQYGELTGMNPEILYIQAAKETNFGKYTGAVRPEMNNWAGIKILNPIGDRTEDHEIFLTPEDGVRGHFNHMGIYCGVAPIGELHPRWYKTNTVKWAGTIQYVEDLGGLWAPNRDYGISIVRDYLNDLYKTAVPSQEDLYKALQLSNKVDEVAEDDIFEVTEIISEYDGLTYAQKTLVPYNIKDRVEQLRRE